MYNYQVTAHKSSAVGHSIVGNFLSSTELSLVVSKGTRIEVFEISSEGLVPILDVPIYGRIGVMQKYRPKNESTDLLFLTTERLLFCVLAIDAKRRVFVTKSHGDLSDRIGAPADYGQIAFVDPEARVIGLHLYRGMMKIIPISTRNGALQDAVNLRLEELHVIDIKFISAQRPMVAVLYQDQREMRHVKTYEISVKEKEMVEGPWNAMNVEVGASLMIPLAEPLGGILLIGERSITYFNANDKSKSLAIKPTIIQSYAQVGTDASRYLLADHTGRLFLLILQLSPDLKSLVDFQLELLGETSAASCLAYLDNQFVFVGSSLGDSQLIRLCPDRDPSSGDYLQLVENYTNIGPIVDMTTVEMDRMLLPHTTGTTGGVNTTPSAASAAAAATSKNTPVSFSSSTLPSPMGSQTQIISCSGAYKDGSLRIIRNGIGISEHAQLDLEGILRVFSLNTPGAASSSSSSSGNKMDVSEAASTSTNTTMDADLPSEKLLFLSYVSETRLLMISGEELEEIRVPGLITVSSTILAANVPGSPFIIQVTPKSIVVVDLSKKQLVDTWKPGGVGAPSSGVASAVASINVAGVAHDLIIVGQGSTMQLLSVNTSSGKLEELGKRNMAYEISCVNLMAEKGEVFCAVGQWHENSIHILHVDNSGRGELRLSHRELLGGEMLPRSVVFAVFEGDMRQLLVGMGDGHVYSFTLDPAIAIASASAAGGGGGGGSASSSSMVVTSSASSLGDSQVLHHKKRMILGRQPVTLIPFENRGKVNVMACGDRPTVVYSKNGKIVFSPMNLPHVNSLCELNTKDFPDALAFATRDAFRIGTVDEIQKLHIRSVPLGEMARRVAHHKPSRSYVVCTAKYETNDATGEETETCAVKLLDDTSFDLLDSFKLDLHECAESVTMVSFAGDSRVYCAVGTGYVIPTEMEPTKGRLLLFEIETGLVPSASSASSNVAPSSSSSSGLASSAPTANLSQSTSSIDKSKLVYGKLKLVHELDVDGMVWSMTAFSTGKLLCTVAYSVQLYAWNDTRDGGRELKLECEHTNHVQALCMATRGDLIYVGDLIRGTSVLAYKPVDGRIEQVAMDLRPNCIMAVAILEDECFLAAENALNLMTVKLNSNAQTNDEREFLVPVGMYHLGDQPNAFRSGSLVMHIPESENTSSDSSTSMIGGKAGGGVGGGGGGSSAEGIGAPSSTSSRKTSDSSKHSSSSSPSSSSAAAASASSSSTFDPSKATASLSLYSNLRLPSLLYATVSGAIGVIATIPKVLFDDLLALQNAILRTVRGIGGFDHAQWRAFHDSKKSLPSTNFIDGDLVESVLDFTPQEQEKLAKAVGLEADVMIKKIEAVAQATH